MSLPDAAAARAALERLSKAACGLESPVYINDSTTVRAYLTALEAEVAALRQEAERLLRFAGRILTVTRKEYGGGDVDGSDVQEWLLADGLLETRMVTEPCGESCVCAEWDEFPQDCHFLTALGDKALTALSPSAPTKEEADA